MKTTLKVLGSVFAMGTVLLVGFHLIMLYGLTQMMREVVLPRVKEETGIDAKVGRLSINMAEGRLFLSAVEVRNPEGFLLENLASVDRVEVELDIPSLFRKKLIRVKSVAVENALVNVIRNKDGEINLNKLQEGLPKSPQPPSSQEPVFGVGETPSGEIPGSGSPASKPGEPEPLPEMLFESIRCNAKVRYVDFKLNQLDIALDLKVNGRGLSTQLEPNTPWGNVSVVGSLGNDRSSFVTDLELRLAPMTNPRAPSFDLAGKVLEVDPQLMAEVYSRMGIRSAPFGFEPSFHCREGWFENSTLALKISDIVLEDKLSSRLGGMGSIGSLRFIVPVHGSLREPKVDVRSALMSAIGGNTQNILEALLRGVASRESDPEAPSGKISDAAVDVLGRHVEEIGESEAVKKVLKDLADGEPSATNAPSPISSDTIIDILGEQVDEIGENEALKEELKDLGRWLFGR